jgi:hypothetical protein
MFVFEFDLATYLASTLPVEFWLCMFEVNVESRGIEILKSWPTDPDDGWFVAVMNHVSREAANQDPEKIQNFFFNVGSSHGV